MKLNPDCMRIILKYCVEHIDYKDVGLNQWHEKSVTLDMLYNSDELKEFEKKEIMYSVMKFMSIGLLPYLKFSPQMDNNILTVAI